MIADLFGSAAAEKVLLYMQSYGETYAREVATAFGISVSEVYKQLIRLERVGVLVSQLKGRTRIYSWNPRYALLPELRALLARAVELLPEVERRRYFMQRRRPRRTGKPK
ncbi:MAG: winged helix-turn-helix domain-containing protein [Nevskiales bacterium]